MAQCFLGAESYLVARAPLVAQQREGSARIRLACVRGRGERGQLVFDLLLKVEKGEIRFLLSTPLIGGKFQNRRHIVR